MKLKTKNWHNLSTKTTTHFICWDKQDGCVSPVEFIQKKNDIKHTDKFLAFSGTWEDTRPVEQIVREINSMNL